MKEEVTVKTVKELLDFIQEAMRDGDISPESLLLVTGEVYGDDEISLVVAPVRYGQTDLGLVMRAHI